MVKILKKGCLIAFLLVLAHLSFACQQTAELGTQSSTGNQYELVESTSMTVKNSLSNELAKMLEVNLQPLGGDQFNY